MQSWYKSHHQYGQNVSASIIGQTGLLAWLATKLAPLTSLLHPARHFDWIQWCQRIFESVNASLCSAPVLAAPDFARPFR